MESDSASSVAERTGLSCVNFLFLYRSVYCIQTRESMSVFCCGTTEILAKTVAIPFELDAITSLQRLKYRLKKRRTGRQSGR